MSDAVEQVCAKAGASAAQATKATAIPKHFDIRFIL
jgi:hypothetical protein